MRALLYTSRETLQISQARVQTLTQPIARGDLFQPHVDVSSLLREPARPEPIHEDACAIVLFSFVVCSLYCYCHFVFRHGLIPSMISLPRRIYSGPALFSSDVACPYPSPQNATPEPDGGKPHPY